MDLCVLTRSDATCQTENSVLNGSEAKGQMEDSVRNGSEAKCQIEVSVLDEEEHKTKAPVPQGKISSSSSSMTWHQLLPLLYPDVFKTTYTVPPLHFNRVPFFDATAPSTKQPIRVSQDPHHLSPASSTAVELISPTFRRKLNNLLHGKPSLSPTEGTQSGSHHRVQPVAVQKSDVHDDFAQQHVLTSLKALGIAEGETMFILSQLNSGSYVHKPCYAAALANTELPKPMRSSDLDIEHTEGAYDMLIIHRLYGILVGEVRSIGRNLVDGHVTQAAVGDDTHVVNRLDKLKIMMKRTHPPPDDDVAQMVQQAVQQLNKSERVVTHLISDIAPGLNVWNTLFLPYVTRQQLQRVLMQQPQLEQEVCSCLGASTAEEAVELCCCSDELSIPHTHKHEKLSELSNLKTWWQNRMAYATDSLLTDDLYLDIVTRLVGPATSVDVHCNVSPRMEVGTEGEAVAGLKRNLTRLMLTPKQLDVLNRSPPLTFLTGPPGTGKTLMMVLQGLHWLLQGYDVHVISVRSSCLAASLMIQSQLETTLEAISSPSSRTGCVHSHHYDVLCEETVADKAVCDLTIAQQGDSLHVLLDEIDLSGMWREGPALLQRLVRELTCRFPHLHLWAAGPYHVYIPSELHTEVLTQPLRCPASVLKQVQEGFDMRAGIVQGYSNNGLPAPKDGRRVIELYHQGSKHTGDWPVDCSHCGQTVAFELRRLGVGAEGQLNYGDVFILTYQDLHDDDKTENGKVTSSASGFVRGLRAAGVPVGVLERHPVCGSSNRKKWQKGLSRVVSASTECVIVTHYSNVYGLERPVVVCLTPYWRARADVVTDRLLVASRCSMQLLMVYSPQDDENSAR